MILVDTNVLLSAAFNITDHRLAAQLLERHIGSIAAPVLWRTEFVHVASKQVRLGNLSLAEALDAAKQLELVVTTDYALPSISAALKISSQYTTSGQDAMFLYWAIKLDTPLITRDKRLVNAAQGHAVLLADYNA